MYNLYCIFGIVTSIIISIYNIIISEKFIRKICLAFKVMRSVIYYINIVIILKKKKDMYIYILQTVHIIKYLFIEEKKRTMI